MKAWPRDAVMIVADTPDKVKVDQMAGGPMEGHCRDCGAKVIYDSYTYNRALLIARGARPVLFFCPSCTVTYDRTTVQRTEDHRQITRN